MKLVKGTEGKKQHLNWLQVSKIKKKLFIHWTSIFQISTEKQEEVVNKAGQKVKVFFTEKWKKFFHLNAKPIFHLNAITTTTIPTQTGMMDCFLHYCQEEGERKIEKLEGEWEYQVNVCEEQRGMQTFFMYEDNRGET